MSVSQAEIQKVMRELASRGGRADSQDQAEARRKNAAKARAALQIKRAKSEHGPNDKPTDSESPVI